MFQLFLKGGPIMGPILLISIIALTVVIERIIFLLLEAKNSNPKTVNAMLAAAEHDDYEKAWKLGAASKDFIARVLTYGLAHRATSLSEALLQAANRELYRFNRGLAILDTIITLAPLLGLLGTVTGMIHAFSLLGNNELNAPTAITGGIAEALIATAFGLSVAIVALIPFNYLNSRLEKARLQIQDAASFLELCLLKRLPPSTSQPLNSFHADSIS
ncbi:MAG: MotA/TolQ/ExbB proton channel family protein [Chthoniobacterales bacterium]